MTIAHLAKKKNVSMTSNSLNCLHPLQILFQQKKKSGPSFIEMNMRIFKPKDFWRIIKTAHNVKVKTIEKLIKSMNKKTEDECQCVYINM